MKKNASVNLLVPNMDTGREVSLNKDGSWQVCKTTTPPGQITQQLAVLPSPNFVADCIGVGGVTFAPKAKAAVLGTMAGGVTTPFLWSDEITESPILGASRRAGRQ